MVLKAPDESEHSEIAKYLDRFGLYETEFGPVKVYVRLAVCTEYGQLRFLILPHLSWVPAERVALLNWLSRAALRNADFGGIRSEESGRGYDAFRHGIATLTSSVSRDPMTAKGLLRHTIVSTTPNH